MGKLSDLWKKLPTLEGQALIDCKKQINSTEQWCKDNGYAGIKSVTDWTSYKPKVKKVYRYAKNRDGGYYRPPNSKTGWERCSSCRHNNRVYCDPDDLYGHTSRI